MTCLAQVAHRALAAIALFGAIAACSTHDDGANPDPAGTGGGTAPTGGAGAGAGETGGQTGETGGTGGGETCAVDSAPDVLTACRLVREDCPATLDEHLAQIEAEDFPISHVVLEADGLREIATTWTIDQISSYAFSDDGTLAGFYFWADGRIGPCETNVYERGQLLRASTTAHRCDLAPDARTTGVVCDCPCPDPAPSDGIHEGGDSCLTVGELYPELCKPTFAEEVERWDITGPIRIGCGVRTLSREALECFYDDAGNLLGSARGQSRDPRDDCAGVERFVSGELPPACDSEITCYLGPEPPPAGEMTCPEEP